MDAALEELKAGVRRFRTDIYPDNKDAYVKAASVPQKPHALIVTCADSRIDPELITQSQPGASLAPRARCRRHALDNSAV